MELVKTDNQLVSITINPEIAKALFHVNYLTPYPYSDMIIEGWAKSIQELEPEITSEVIKWILDNMKKGLIEYDSKKGIQNIFSGFVKYCMYILRNSKDENVKKNFSDLYKKYNTDNRTANFMNPIL